MLDIAQIYDFYKKHCFYCGTEKLDNRTNCKNCGATKEVNHAITS